MGLCFFYTDPSFLFHKCGNIKTTVGFSFPFNHVAKKTTGLTIQETVVEVRALCDKNKS